MYLYVSCCRAFVQEHSPTNQRHRIGSSGSPHSCKAPRLLSGLTLSLLIVEISFVYRMSEPDWISGHELYSRCTSISLTISVCSVLVRAECENPETGQDKNCRPPSIYWPTCSTRTPIAEQQQSHGPPHYPGTLSESQLPRSPRQQLFKHTSSCHPSTKVAGPPSAAEPASRLAQCRLIPTHQCQVHQRQAPRSLVTGQFAVTGISPGNDSTSQLLGRETFPSAAMSLARQLGNPIQILRELPKIHPEERLAEIQFLQACL